MKTKLKKFVVGENSISWLGQNFKEHFSFSFKEVDAKLKTKKLPRAMTDKEILSELRPEEVSLAEVYNALKSLHKNLLYLFYVRDENKNLWAVGAGWDSDGDGWHVEAYSVARPRTCSAGDQVLSSRFSEPQDKTLSPSDTLSLESLSLRLEKLEQ